MRKFRTESEWQSLFREQSRTGRSVREFCREAGIHPNHWYRKRKEYENPGRFIKLGDAAGRENREMRIEVRGVLIHTGLFGMNGLAVLLGVFGTAGHAGL